MRATVIGAGIGGLCAAVGLHRAGWRVTVLEQASSIEPLGTCIALAPNALRAIDALGIGEKFREFAVANGRGGIRDPRGRWLSTLDLGAVAERFAEPLVVTRRGRLAEVLRAALPSSALHTGVRVTGVYDGVVHTDSGASSAELIVGADGVFSAVRGSLFPWYGGPHKHASTVFRFVVEMPGFDYPGSETWGRGRSFGIVPFAKDTVYCFAAGPAEWFTPERNSPEQHSPELLRHFGDWHQPIPQLIAAAQDSRILRHRLYSLAPPPPRFHHRNTVLLGDAAHAMAPNLGQGGCQAIEDAATLAMLLSGMNNRMINDVPRALAEYSRIRRPRTAALCRASARVAAVANARSPLARAARDAALRTSALLPDALLLGAMSAQLNWEPDVRSPHRCAQKET